MENERVMRMSLKFFYEYVQIVFCLETHDVVNIFISIVIYIHMMSQYVVGIFLLFCSQSRTNNKHSQMFKNFLMAEFGRMMKVMHR